MYWCYHIDKYFYADVFGTVTICTILIQCLCICLMYTFPCFIVIYLGYWKVCSIYSSHWWKGLQIFVLYKIIIAFSLCLSLVRPDWFVNYWAGGYEMLFYKLVDIWCQLSLLVHTHKMCLLNSLWPCDAVWRLCPDTKVYGTNMGSIWDRQDPGGPHVGPMTFAIWVVLVNIAPGNGLLSNRWQDIT